MCFDILRKSTFRDFCEAITYTFTSFCSSWESVEFKRISLTRASLDASKVCGCSWKDAYKAPHNWVLYIGETKIWQLYDCREKNTHLCIDSAAERKRTDAAAQQKQPRDLVSPVVRPKRWENQDVSGKVTLKIKHRKGKEQMMETSLLAAGIISMGIHQPYLPPMLVSAPKEAPVLPLWSQ